MSPTHLRTPPGGRHAPLSGYQLRVIVNATRAVMLFLAPFDDGRPSIVDGQTL